MPDDPHTSRLRELRDLFERALVLRPAAREALLREVGSGDPELARELLDLLERDTGKSEGSFRPLVPPMDETRVERGRGPAPESIGTYRILGRLGAGGMGEVFRAQDPRRERDIALKVLPAVVAGRSDRCTTIPGGTRSS